jgi:predicted molibdopterin-dependent oxidoreductase YjgC
MELINYGKGGFMLRIEKHPVITFSRGKQIKFTFDGSEITRFEGETIAAALHAAGVKILGHSHKRNRPRGFYCGIGNCSSCLMTVDGTPNVRVCTEKLQENMQVETQVGRGELFAKD